MGFSVIMAGMYASVQLVVTQAFGQLSSCMFPSTLLCSAFLFFLKVFLSLVVLDALWGHVDSII